MTATILIALAAAAAPQMQMQMQSSSTDSTVTVTSTQTVRIPATGASLYVTIDGTAETASGALARVAEKLRAVSDSIRGFGRRVVADAPIPYRVAAVAPQNGYPNASSTGFIAHTLIRVRVLNIADLALFHAAVLTAGAANVTGQTFESASSDSTWRSLAAKATAGARETAETLAGTHGKRLGALVETHASGSGGTYQSPSQISLDPRSNVYGASAPEVVVTMNVTHRFRLVPGGS
jgi:uncharacterized protein YggE